MTKHYHDGEPFPGHGRPHLRRVRCRRGRSPAARARGRAQRRARRPRRRRLRAARLLRLRHRHAALRPPRGATGCATATSTPRRCARRRAPACSPGATTTRARWAASPTWRMGFPGYNGRIPKSCGFVPEVLRQAGWATFAVGKWHLAPSDEQHTAAPRDRWPLGPGLRALLRLPRRRDEPVRPRSGDRQHPDPLRRRPTATT